MNRIKNAVLNHWPLLVLFILSILICLTNYAPNTFLSGWDTLHPEFDFELNIKRVIFGVFRTEQGLGAVAGHSHMADLPRILLLYLFHFFLPLSFLRYAYVFLTLIIGPIGMYLFLKRVVVKQKVPAFLGALFYLLNLGTMQQFVVPFEMFTTQYGFLPWLFLFATDYMQHGKKSALILFSLSLIFSAPMAYASTLWHVWFFAFALYLTFLSLQSQHKKNVFKKTALLLSISILLNAYWLLPNIYYVLTYAKSVADANINKLFSPQAFLYNKEFGNIKDISLLKTFLFDWNVYVGDRSFAYLLTPWMNHLKNTIAAQIGFIFALLSLLGLIFSWIKKNHVAKALLPILLLSLFFLFNDNPPTGFLYKFLQVKLPLFSEALRFPDDKVLGLFTFAFAIYVAFAQLLLQKTLSKLPTRTHWISSIIQTGVFGALLIYFMLPAFSGAFISPYLRIQIPKEYFEVFSYFSKQKDEGRIANLPIHSLWGWEYYNWYNNQKPSFQGAGFLWFGIKQPFMARDFDRWIPQNEQYYREMTYAVYSKDPRLLANVIKKYNIHYILLDKNIIAPELEEEALFYPEIESMLDTLIEEGSLKKPQNFGKIAIYQTAEIIQKPYTYSIQTQTSVWPPTPVLYKDYVFEQYGNYITPKKESDAILYFPFRNIADNTGKIQDPILSETRAGIKINPPKTLENQNIIVPSYIDSQNQIFAKVMIDKTNTDLTVSVYPYSFFSNVYYSPIKKVFSLSNAKSTNQLILTINQTDSFFVPQNTGEAQLGDVLLSTSEPNSLALFVGAPQASFVLDFANTVFSLEPCNPNAKGQLYGYDFAVPQGGITLFAQDLLLCMMLPFANIPSLIELLPASLDEAILVKSNFSYKGEGAPNMCLSEIQSSTCIKTLNTTDYFTIKRENLNNQGLKVVLDTTSLNFGFSPLGQILETSKRALRVSYTDFSFAVTKELSNTFVTSNDLRAALLPFSAINPKEESIVIPKTRNVSFSKNFAQFPNGMNNCQDNKMANNNTKKRVEKKEGLGDAIEYTSIQGPLCDSFPYQVSSEDTAFLVTITSKNIAGLPLTVCISNPISKRCSVYASLTRENKLSSTTFLLPPKTHNENGFNVNINNFAIKGSPSVNQLYDIQVTPFPYAWLSNIFVKSESKLPQSKELLVHSYSFESGWKAYQITNYKLPITNFLNTAFPFVFGTQLKEHVLVDNWSNGWVLDTNTPYAIGNTLVIVYLPQYLEYAGFFLLLLTLTIVLKQTIKKGG